MPNNIICENNHKKKEEEFYYEDEFGSIKTRKELNDNVILYYLTTLKGKHCRWEFYEKDADPHPSVPHGHGIQLTNLRIDPLTLPTL